MNRPVYRWVFQSSSGSGTYETLLWEKEGGGADGFTCNCPGWTRRVGAYGERTCKHVRACSQNDGHTGAVSHGAVGATTAKLHEWQANVFAGISTPPKPKPKPIKKVTVMPAMTLLPKKPSHFPDPMEQPKPEPTKPITYKRKIDL